MSEINDLVSDPVFVNAPPEKQQAVLNVFFTKKLQGVPAASQLGPSILDQTRQAFVAKFMPNPASYGMGGAAATIGPATPPPAPAAAPPTPPGPTGALPKTPSVDDSSLLQKATNYVKNLPSAISEGATQGVQTLKDAATAAATAALPSLPKFEGPPTLGNTVVQAAKTATAPLTDSFPTKIAQQQVTAQQQHETLVEGMTGKPMTVGQQVADTALRMTFLGGVVDRSMQPKSIKNTLLDTLDIMGAVGGAAELLAPAEAIKAATVVKNIAAAAPKLGLGADDMQLLGKVANQLSEIPEAADVLKGAVPAAEAEAAPKAATTSAVPADSAHAASIRAGGGLPTVDPGSKTGEPHALYAYSDDFGPDGTRRDIYNVFGDPNDPAVKQVGWGSSITKAQIDAAGIPVAGREPRAAEKGWFPVGEAGGAEPVAPSPEPPSAGGPPAPPTEPPAGTPPPPPSGGSTPPRGDIGQFNIARFQDPDVRSILEQTQKDTAVQAQIIGQKRGVISDDQLNALADKVDLTPEQLRNMAPGSVLNAEGILKANQTLGAVAKSMANLAQKYKAAKVAGDPAAIGSIMHDSQELMQPFVDTLVNTRAIASELGRALRQQRIAIETMGPMEKQLIGDAIEGSGAFDPERMAGILDKVGGLGGDEDAIASALTSEIRPTITQKIVDIATSLKLSSPVTLLRHNLGNTLAVLTRFGEKGAQGAVDMLRTTFTGAPRQRFAAEAGGYLFGLSSGLADAGRAFMARLLDTVPLEGSVASEGLGRPIPAIGGVTGRVLHASSRLLEAGDQFFQTILNRGELYSVALRKAAQEGLQMGDRWDRVQELVQNPTDDMLEAAYNVQKEYNYKAPLGPATQKLDDLRGTFGGLPKLLVPFFRTPVNVGKFIIQRSPLALTPVPTSRFYADLAMGGGAATDAITRATLGSAFQGLMVDLALKGYLTGQGPSNKGQRDLLQRQGWQPYSFHIGDKYYSFQLFDPLTFGAAADIADAWTTRKEVPTTDLVTKSALSILKNLVNQPFLRTVHDVIQSIQDERGAGKFVDAFVSGFVPSGIGLIDKVQDPVVRQPKGVLQSVEARIPGLSQNVPPRVDVFGEPYQREGSFPIQTSTAKTNPVDTELQRLSDQAGFAIGFKPQKIGGRPLDQWDYVNMQKLIGQELKPDLQQLFTSRRYQNMADDERVNAVKKLERDATQDIHDQMRVPVELKALGLPDVTTMALPDDLKRTLVSRLKTRIESSAYSDKTDDDRKQALKEKLIDVLKNYRGG